MKDFSSVKVKKNKFKKAEIIFILAICCLIETSNQ